MHPLFDAHCHLQDAQLASVLPDLPLSVRGWIVNGTSPDDWDAVAVLADRDSRVVPAFGLHPWCVNPVNAERFTEKLQGYLQKFPNAHVGEIGVDRWKTGLDEALQVEALAQQLEIAAEFERPATIHCLKAWGMLEEAWAKARGVPKVVLLHAFNGSKETAHVWMKRGAYFSYSTYFLHERKAPTREVFRYLPIERLLVETDAPAMSPPVEFCVELGGLNPDDAINHPLNLSVAYQSLADVRGLVLDALVSMISENFLRFIKGEL